jgi:hypothetical protein
MYTKLKLADLLVRNAVGAMAVDAYCYSMLVNNPYYDEHDAVRTAAGLTLISPDRFTAHNSLNAYSLRGVVQPLILKNLDLLQIQRQSDKVLVAVVADVFVRFVVPTNDNTDCVIFALCKVFDTYVAVGRIFVPPKSLHAVFEGSVDCSLNILEPS